MAPGKSNVNSPAALQMVPIHGFSSDANGNITITDVTYKINFGTTTGNLYLNEFQDNYDPRYSTTNTFGRMDPIVNYQGTSRRITLSIALKADASNGAGLHEKIKKILYPTYEAAATIPNALLIQRPPLVAVKLPSLIHSPIDSNGYLLCVLESYSMTPGLGFTPLDSPLYRIATDGDPIVEFQDYNFRFDFIPLHPVTPGFVEDSSGKFQWVGGDNF
jgi:hypothetical protein